MPRLWVWLSNQELVLRLVSEAEPTQQANCGRKNVSRSKKSQHFLKKPLDTSHSFGMLNEFFCEKLGEPLDT